jgi:anti-sigma B factor antagonist
MQPFSSTTEIRDGVAKVALAGEIDASAAPAFRTEIEKVAAQNPRRLALLMHEVSYMASAGLRVLIFAKQRLGTDVDIFVVGAQAPVLETLRTTGFDYGCVLLDSYDAQQIENIGSAR